MRTTEQRVDQMELDLKDASNRMHAHEKECERRHARLDEQIRTLFRSGENRGRLLWGVLAAVLGTGLANMFFGG